jgi:hypothetical protein
LVPDPTDWWIRRLQLGFYSIVFNALSGANGEGRTPMPLRALEPKSRASANSATFAHRAAELQNYTNASR